MALSCSSPPFSLEISSLSDFDGQKKNRNAANILDHYFNHGITLVIPGENTIPQYVRDSFSDVFSYRLSQLPVYRLLEIPFISAFVKKGSVHLLSSDTKLDTQDCAAVTPTGFLLLHLTKDTYQELGLDAVQQTYQQKKNDIYVVKIDLKADHFRPGKKGYDKVMNCLKNRIQLKFNFLVSWVPHDSQVCSSSIGVYFTDLCNRVECIDPKIESRVLTSMRYPVVCADDPEGQNSACHFMEVFEWIGSLACDIDITSVDNENDSYASSFSCPEPNVNCPRCSVIQVKGFFPPIVIINLMKNLKERKSASQLPVSLTVQGFKDSPVLHKVVPHDVYMAGVNLYSFLLMSGADLWLYTASAT